MKVYKLCLWAFFVKQKGGVIMENKQIDLQQIAQEMKRKYQREYYKKEENKDKRKEYMKRYWEKKAKKVLENMEQ